MSSKIILVGGFHELIELCCETGYEIVGIIDNALKNSYMGYPILGCDDNAKDLFDIYGEFPLVITPDSPKVRSILFNLYSSKGFSFATIISKRANISPSAIIGEGVVIQSGVNVSSSTHIGNFVKLNSSANVMHDTKIEAFTTIAPNAVVLGRVHIGKKVYIGANSTILPGLKIADGTMIGAGAVVVKEISTAGVFVGVPAKQIK